MELTTWHFGGRRDGPSVLITGGIHGDEFEPIAAIRALARVLGRLDPRGRVALIPVVNEDAFRRGRRTAEDGLDLARTCPGRADGSITERVAHALSATIAAADAYVDLHTGGARLKVYPLSGYMLHPDPGVLDRQRRMARVFGLPVVWGTDPGLDGRSLSSARDARVPAIYAEYLGGGGCDPRGVAAYLRGCLNVLVDLGMIDGELALSPDDPLVVEDARPHSGHMQIQHPAPCGGLFEAVARLGQRVQEGEILGTVADLPGPDVVPVVADRAGIVLVLRAFARVAQGESLAVVLETDRDPPAWTFQGGTVVVP
jgi:predicted deacylase